MIAFSLSSTSTFTAQALPTGRPASLLSELFTNVFVLLILALSLYSLYKLVRYLMRLRGQRNLLGQVEANYVELEKKQEKNPEIIREDLLKGVDESSIVAQRVKELYRISVHGGDFDQVALSEVLAAREAAHVSIARYAASVLVLLGLCGAIWGLSSLVYQMGPALNQVQDQLERANAQRAGGATGANPDTIVPIQDSFKTLINTMSESLVNTRGAFAASLTGIISSTILLMFNWWSGRRQVEFLSALEDITATRLIPLFKPRSDAAELSGVVDSFKEGSGHLVRLSENLDGRVLQVGESLGELFSVVRKFRESSEALHDSQALVHEAQQQMLDVVKEFVGVTSRIEAHQAESRAKLSSVISAVEDSNGNIGRAIEEWRNTHESVLQLIQQNSLRVHEESTEARRIAEEGIKNIAALIQTSFDTQVGTLRAQVLEMQEQQHTANRTHIQEVVMQQGVFIAELRDAVAESDGHRELLDGLASLFKEERRAFADRLDAMLRQNESGLRTMVSEQQKLLDISGMKKVEERLENFVTSSRVEFDRLAKHQHESAARFDELGDLAARLGRLIRLLIAVAIVSIPVFAALAVMFILDLRPADMTMRLVSLLAILAMIGLLAWFLRSKH
jgi:hypothetical protein